MNLAGVPVQLHTTVFPAIDGLRTIVTTVPTEAAVPSPARVITPPSVTLPLTTLPYGVTVRPAPAEVRPLSVCAFSVTEVRWLDADSTSSDTFARIV